MLNKGSEKATASVLGLLMFGLLFFGFTLGLGYFKLWPEASLWLNAKQWPSTPGQLLFYQLNSSQSNNSRTYSIEARYRYEVDAVTYTSSRVGIHSGRDNIGNFHQRWYSVLQQHERNGDPLTVWYNPDDPGQALLDRDIRWGLMIMQIGFSLVFALVGAGVIWTGLNKRLNRKNAEDSAVETPAALSSLDVAAAEPIAPSASHTHWFLWIFAVVWNLVSFAAVFACFDKMSAVNRTEDYLLYLILLFPLAGMLLLWQAIKASLLHARYGQSRLRMDPCPGQAGGQVGGEIRLSTPLPLDAMCEVRLECLRSRETRNSKGQKSTSVSVEWQDVMMVRGRLEARQTIVPYVFDVPGNLPPSQPQSADYFHWKIHVDADIPGLDLELDFDVPVGQGSALSKTRIPGRERQQQLQRTEQLAKVLNVEQNADTLYLRSDYGRELAGSLLLVLVGGVFLGSGVGIGFAQMGPGLIEWPTKLLFCTVFGGLGFFLLLLGILTPLTRLETAIDQQKVHVRRLFLGWVVYQKAIEFERIQGLETHRNGSISNGRRTRNWFQLRLQGDAGHQVIAESIPGRVLADEALAFLRGNTPLP